VIPFSGNAQIISRYEFKGEQMPGITGKQQLEVIDGTPKKRLFLSIISDYGLQTGLCELVDNALDLWITNGRKPAALSIDVTLDYSRQLISVRDNAGGITRDQLELLISPGASRNDPNHELIGIFGVGGKRAGVALGEHVEIRTRAKRGMSLQLDITNDWLATEDWGIAAYEIPDIEQGTTTVDISRLRQPFSEGDVEEIRQHLAETYQWFISEGCVITLNKDPVAPRGFKNWSYPPEYRPRTSTFDISPVDDKSLSITVTAGLINDRDPEQDNYGVYFYCNHRLIVKELRTRDVGYNIGSEAGVPHPDASLCRVIIELQGPAELMPWNSTKSGLNFTHPSFIQIRPVVIAMAKYFSSLSRRLKRDWDSQVFAYSRGKLETIDPNEILSNRKIVLPTLPRTRALPRIDQLRVANKGILRNQPWTLGLVEALGLVELISKQKMDTKNRAALILLDSNFEIGLKEFIVNRKDLFPPRTYNDAKIASLFGNRTSVINEVQPHINLSSTLLGKVSHYYLLRNKLIHERATVGITDNQVDDYRKTIEQVLRVLFKLKFPKQ
jgi:hypothetical protein